MDSEEEHRHEVEHPYVVQLRKQEERHRAWLLHRQQYLERLMGSTEQFDWDAPQPLADLDAQLGEHAAQLRNAARYLMGKVLDDETRAPFRPRARWRASSARTSRSPRC